MVGRLVMQTAAELKREALRIMASPNTPTVAAAKPDSHLVLPPQDDPVTGPVTDLFRRYTTAQLLAEPDEFSWLLRGVLADPTYGQVAGEMKSLKSTIVGIIQVGLAAGVPIFDRFTPTRSRPVVAYVGEGGRIPYIRRLRRIAAALNVDLGDIPLHLSFDTAPVMSSIFQESLSRDLDDLRPGLVTLDPLYAYHGSQTKASDLHAEGGLLNAISRPCVEADASLLIVNHFNQTGTGTSLKRITMAGSGEHADSWLLVAHREPPDIENGAFRLSLEIGSRQWGGTTWDLDLNIGRFDEDRGSHDGDITWDLKRAPGVSATVTACRDEAVARTRQTVLEVLADMPWQLTKTEVLDRVGGNREHRKRALESLADEGRIRHDQIARNESGGTKRRPLWGINPNPAQSDGHTSTTREQ